MLKSINKIVKSLIFSDIFLNSGWGLLSPVFAIFIVQGIQGGDAKVAGFATATYWIVKSVLQIPLAKYLDRNRGEADDFYFLFFGILLTGLVPFGYMFAAVPWHIYALQVFYAVGMAMAVPAWYAIYTRHIDKGREASEWGLYSTSLGFVVGLSGAIGGMMADNAGFKFMFIVVGLFTVVSALSLLWIKKEIVTPHVHDGAASNIPGPRASL